MMVLKDVLEIVVVLNKEWLTLEWNQDHTIVSGGRKGYSFASQSWTGAASELSFSVLVSPYISGH